MYKNKRIGFYLPPLPKSCYTILLKKNKIKTNKKYSMITNGYLKKIIPSFINNGIEVVYIHHNMKYIDNILNTLDGIFFTGNYAGDEWYKTNDSEHIKHFKFFKIVYNKILDINKNERPFFVAGKCYNQELLVKMLEKKKYNENKLIKKVKNNNSKFNLKTNFVNKQYYVKNNSKFGVSMGLYLTDFNNTKILKKKYDIISLYKLKNKNIIDIIKHKKYPIFFSKSTTFQENKKIRKEMFETIEISNYYRKNFMNKKYFVPKLSYKKILINKVQSDKDWPYPEELKSMMLVEI